MKKVLTTVCFLVILMNSHTSQSIVTNGGFDVGSACPTYLGGLGGGHYLLTPGWTNAANTIPIGSTADVACVSGNTFLPTPAFSPVGTTSLAFLGIPGAGTEGATTDLTSTVPPGDTIKITLLVYSGNVLTRGSNHSSMVFGVYFYNTGIVPQAGTGALINSANPQHLTATPQIVIPSSFVVDNTWKTFYYEYVATTTINKMAIGFFRPGSAAAVTGTGGYYAVDGLSAVVASVCPSAPTGTGGNANICPGGSFTFPSRTCASGTLRWYENSGGTGTFHTGASVSPVNSTTTYYPFCSTTCNSPVGSSVTATTQTTPTTPTATSASTITGCSGFASTLSGTCATGSIRWYNSATGTGAGIGSSLTVNSNQTVYARCFNSANASGCQYSTAATGIALTVQTTPTTPTATSASPTSGCNGFTSALSGTCATGSIRWYNSATGTGAGLGASITVNSNQTVYARCFNSSNASGCQYSIAATGIALTVQTTPTTPTATSASPISGCSGFTSTLSGTCTTGAIRWYNSATGTGAGLGASLTVNSNQTVYARCFNSSNASGCQYSTASTGINLTITTPTAPTGTGGDANICSGSNFSFPSRTCASGTLRWYENSAGTGTFHTASSVGPLSTNTTYYPFCFSACNSPVGTTATATIGTPASANNTTPTAPICETDTKTLSGTPGGGTWSVVSGGGTILGTTYTPGSITSDISVTIRYLIPASGGCPADSSDATFTVNNYDSAINTTNTDTICETETKTLAGSPIGGSWVLINGNGTILGNTYTPNDIIAPETVLISYEFSANGSCSSNSDSVSFVVNPAPEAIITSSNTDLCTGSFSILTGSPLGGTWNIVSGAATITNDTIFSTDTGVLVINYIVTNANGCSDTASQSINSVTSPNDPIVSTNGNDTICLGESITINAIGSGSGITYNVYSSAVGSSWLGTTTYTISPILTSTYYIDADNGTCMNNGGRQPITIVVNPVPSVTITPNTTICPTEQVVIVATGGGNYLWSTGSTNDSIIVSPTNDSIFIVDVSNTSGCRVIDSCIITVLSGSAANGLDDEFTAPSGEDTLIDIYINDVGDQNSMAILNGPYFGNASITGGNLTYQSDSNYFGRDSLQYVICDAVCTSLCDTAFVYITVERELDITQFISPNDDGLNDFFNVVGLEKYPNNELKIFNRWGDLVYQSKPYKNDWRGENNTKGVFNISSTTAKLNSGTYYYILDLGDNREPLTGFVQVKR